MKRVTKVSASVAFIATGVLIFAEPEMFPDEITDPVAEILSVEGIDADAIISERNFLSASMSSERINPLRQAEPAEDLIPEEKVTAPDKEIPPEEPSPSVEPSPTEEATPSVTISSYVNCGAEFQACIDNGNLTYYAGHWKNGEWSQLLAGHDYMGFAWLNSVPLGTIVNVTSGPAQGTYRAYDHLYIGRQGGDMPRFYGADLVLQSCQGSGTGFTLLDRIN